MLISSFGKTARKDHFLLVEAHLEHKKTRFLAVTCSTVRVVFGITDPDPC